MPEINYGKISSWKTGIVLTPPNFIISDEDQCADFKDFDPLDYNDWDLIDNFDDTDIDDQYDTDEGELRNVNNIFSIFKIDGTNNFLEETDVLKF